jgi:hypothetical protein
MVLGMAAIALVGLASCGGSGGRAPTAPAAPASTAPAAPANVQVAAGDQKNVITWNASSGATSYNLYFKVGAGATTADTKISAVTSPYTHGSLTNGTLYSYIVTAVNSAGESGARAPVEATPVLGPLYVSVTTGLDTNDGSQAHPVQTLARAYVIAGLTGRTSLKLAAGIYHEVPTLQPGIDIEGGFGLPGWTLPGGSTEFDLGAGTAIASNITVPTTILGVSFRSTLTPAGNSIALLSANSNANLVFQDCGFLAIGARFGSIGADGVAGATGGNGGLGAAGSCDGPNGSGGLAGVPAAGGCAGGAGGAGGLENGGGNGTQGGAGDCSGGSIGTGGFVGNPGTSGGDGGAGADGATPSDPVSASAAGSIISGQWVPETSNTGSDGTNGRGGGGGGGGGAQQCTLCNNGGGNGGGGGGAGGTGGTSGHGGGGGYGSFAVFLDHSSPTFNNCMFWSDAGGEGGSGGNAGKGSPGGTGGNGATVCTGEIGAGGTGGHGGKGGDGAAGPGGPGGPSFCIYRVSSTPVVTSPSYFPGPPGAGGPGGAHASDSSHGFAGLPGIGGNTN